MTPHDPQQQLNYAQDELPRRTVGTWGKLLLVWSVGLLVWCLYIGVIVFFFFRFFTARAD